MSTARSRVGRGRSFCALLSGLLFGAGLVVSGMAQPSKVLAFLTWSRAWDPSLLFVMFGAITVHASAQAFARRRARASGAPLPISGQRGVDGMLLFGAAVFGVGWAIAGYCPGPAVVALSSFRFGPWLFVSAFFVGSFAGEAVRSWRRRWGQPEVDVERSLTP